jgi:nitrogen regulatory protein PII
MKQINAYIARHKFDAVACALHRIKGLTGMSVFDRSGSGVSWAKTKIPEQIDLDSGLKLEIICRDELVGTVIDAVEKAAHTGLRNDGKIYVLNIEQAVRISTGERGEEAA